MSTLTEIALDSQQQAVVDAPGRAIVLTARAGTGKTEVVARRVERLLTERMGRYGRVLAVSYTKKAAHSMQVRFEARLGSLAERVDAQTLHAFAHDVVRDGAKELGWPEDPEILTRDLDRLALLEEWLAEEGVRVSSEQLSARLRDIDGDRTGCRPSEVADAWHRALRREGALDYPALLILAEELLRAYHVGEQTRRRYEHVIVDEAQNLTAAQYALLVSLLGPGPKPELGALLAGDEGLAGGSSVFLERFAVQYCADRFELQANYRCARKLVELIRSVRPESVRPERTTPELHHPAPGCIETAVTSTEVEEGRRVADWVDRLLSHGMDPGWLAPGEAIQVEPSQIAVIGRTAKTLAAVEAALTERGVGTAVSLGTPRPWVSSRGRAVLALLDHACGDRRGSASVMQDLLRNELDGHDCDWTMALPRSDLHRLAPLVDATELAEFMGVVRSLDGDDGWLEDREFLGLLERSYGRRVERRARSLGSFRVFVQRELGGRDLEEGVRLLSIHRSQGREYRAVAVVGLNDGQLPDFRATSEEDIAAERRVFYVALTRPTRCLLLTRSRTRSTRIGPRAVGPSRFLIEAGISDLD